MEAIGQILNVMGIAGLLMLGLAIANIATGCAKNIMGNGEEFCIKKMLKGLLKTLVLYAGTTVLSVVFTALPYLNTMIGKIYGVELISAEALQNLSNTGVLAIIISVILMQSMKVLGNVKEAWGIKTSKEEVITWEVKDPEQETEE